jgi:hypothetical protein
MAPRRRRVFVFNGGGPIKNGVPRAKVDLDSPSAILWREALDRTRGRSLEESIEVCVAEIERGLALSEAKPDPA